MSRYLILIILNTPFVLFGIIGTITSYKTRSITKSQFRARIAIWLVIIFGLIFAQTLYNFLFSNNLTKTQPLSLFDVIEITGIILTFSLCIRAYTKVDILEQQLRLLHQQLSINIADKENTNS